MEVEGEDLEVKMEKSEMAGKGSNPPSVVGFRVKCDPLSAQRVVEVNLILRIRKRKARRTVHCAQCLPLPLTVHPSCWLEDSRGRARSTVRVSHCRQVCHPAR